VTGNAWEIARIIEPHVARVIVVSPSDTGIRQARAKTDRLDAGALARLLWSGQLAGVWTPDERIRAMRRRLARQERDHERTPTTARRARWARASAFILAACRGSRR
jgi:hypothetical protein